MATLKGMLAGAALGTVLGSLAVIFYPKRREIIEAILNQSNDLSGKARAITEHFRNTNAFAKKKATPVNGYMTSGLIGMCIGAGAALLVSPKSGKQIRAQIAKNYNNIFGKTEEVFRFIRNNAPALHMNGMHPHHVASKSQRTARSSPKLKTKGKARMT